MASEMTEQRGGGDQGISANKTLDLRDGRRSDRLEIRYVVTQDNFNTPEDQWMIPVILQADADERPDGHEDFESALEELVEEFDCLIEEVGGDPDDDYDCQAPTYLDCLLQRRGDSQDCGDDWEGYCCGISQPKIYLGDRGLNLADLAERREFESERAEGYPSAPEGWDRTGVEWAYAVVLDSLGLPEAGL